MAPLSRTTLVSVSAVLLLAGQGLAQLNPQPLLVSGAAAPGGLPGVKLSSLFAPSIAGNGQIAFRATLRGTGVNATNDSAIFAGGLGPAAPIRLISRLGANPAGLPGNIKLATLGDPLVNAAGHTVYLATLTGPGVTFANNKVLIITDNRGARVLARTGAAAPGMASNITISDIQQPLISPSGHVAFTTLFAGPQMWSGTNRALYVAPPGGLPALTVRQNAQVAGQATGITWANFSAPAMTASGRLVFLGFIQGTGVTTAADAVIYSTAGQILAREGDSFGVAGMTFRSFSSPTITGETVGFMAMLNDANSGQMRGGVFTATTDGVQLLARSGQANQSLASGTNWQLFGQPTLAAGGKAAFLATLTGAGVSAGSNDISLWSVDSAGTRQVLRTGDAIPGSPDVLFDAIDQPAISGSGHIVFTARLRGAGITGATENGLFAYHPGSGLLTVARTGRPMSIGPSMRTAVGLEVSRNSSDGRPSCLTDSGSMVFLLRGADSSAAIRVPLPSSIADIAGAGNSGADGRIDQSDLAAFLGLFAARNPLADVTGANSPTRDGQVTAADMQAFMAAYTAASANQ